MPGMKSKSVFGMYALDCMFEFTDRLSDLEQECAAYEALHSLQGVCLPVVRQKLYTRSALYLIMDKVEGVQLQDIVSSPRLSSFQCKSADKVCANSVRTAFLNLKASVWMQILKVKSAHSRVVTTSVVAEEVYMVWE
jgi:hypothetical protein